MKKVLHTTIATLLLMAPLTAQADSDSPAAFDPVLSQRLDDLVVQELNRGPTWWASHVCMDRLREWTSARTNTDRFFKLAQMVLWSSIHDEKRLDADGEIDFRIVSTFAQAAVTAKAEGHEEILLTPDQAFLACVNGLGDFGEKNSSSN